MDLRSAKKDIKNLEKIHIDFADSLIADSMQKLEEFAAENGFTLVDNPIKDEDAKILKEDNRQIIEALSEDDAARGAIAFYDYLKAEQAKDKSDKGMEKLLGIMNKFISDFAEQALENTYDGYAQFKSDELKNMK